MNQKTKPNYIVPAVFILIIIVIIFILPNHKSQQFPYSQWSPQWRTMPAFKLSRRALTSVAHRGYLYVIGGINDQNKYVRPVEFTAINEDGSLGQWKPTSALQTGRFYLSAAAYGDYMYVIGGGIGAIGSDNIPTASVERARILDNGELAAWHPVNQLSTPRRGLKVVQIKNHLYATGGYNGTFLKSVEHSQILPSGELSEWRQSDHQAVVDRYIHSAATYKDFIYVLGGHVQNTNVMSYGDVEMTRMLSNTQLDKFNIEKTRISIARFIASSFALNGKLYILGGHNGGVRLNNVEFSPIYRDGHLGQWQPTAVLNQARSATTVSVYNNTAYVLGGMGETSTLNTVEAAQQAPNGQLGYLGQDKD